MRRLVLLLLLSFGIATHANGQTTVGVHYSALANEYPDETLSGVGAFATFSRRLFGVEAATTFFPSADTGERAWQLLAGPRVGVTWRDVALYGRVRPGFVRFSERFYKPEVVCIAIFPPPEACLASRTSLQLDLGGTVEVGVTPSAVLRLDLGDTLTRYNQEPLAARWTHGLQFTAGVGWKF